MNTTLPFSKGGDGEDILREDDAVLAHPQLAVKDSDLAIEKQAQYNGDISGVRRQVREVLQLIGTLFSVSNVSFGPDGGGRVIIAVQGEKLEQAKALLPDFLFCSLGQGEYQFLVEHQQDTEKRAA